ncbi:MAG TPA: hypothetical protein PKY81_11645 [bacterium]|nr:hypothetical protein [bacterium]HPN31601.1 hypothetical protein [bacterium]
MKVLTLKILNILIIGLAIFFCIENYAESNNDIIQDNSVTLNEDRSEYFRNEILNNLTKTQILNYLNRKEANEKSTSKELSAKYILNLLPPYDRKLDPAIGDNWNALSSAEKDALRYEWFQKNKNSVSTRELQNFIAINDLIQKAREAENQRKLRGSRQRLDFAQTMTDSQFMTLLEKTVKNIAPKVEPAQVAVKPIVKETVQKKSYSTKSKPIKSSKKKSGKTSKSKKTAKVKTGKVKETFPVLGSVKPRDFDAKENAENIENKVKTRELNVSGLKNEPPKKVSEDNQFDEKIKTLQSKISTLKNQLNTTSTEIDSLKNIKKSIQPETRDENKTREELRKLELEKIKSIGVE